MTTTDVLTATLSELYATLTDHPPSTHPAFDALVLETACAAMDDQDRVSYPDTLRTFVQMHYDDLAALLRQYGPGSGFDKHEWYGTFPYQLTRSPAVIAVCERLTVSPMLLRAMWDERWESDAMLDDLHGAWGR